MLERVWVLGRGWKELRGKSENSDKLKTIGV